MVYISRVVECSGYTDGGRVSGTWTGRMAELFVGGWNSGEGVEWSSS